MSRFWFRPKAYGYGATPITWEGWAIVVVYIAVVLAAVVRLSHHNNTLSTWLSAAAVIAVATGVMGFVGQQKTDGTWSWRWGSPKNSRKAD